MTGVRAALSHIARAQHDQPRIRASKGLVAEAEALDDTGAHVLYEHIRPIGEPARNVRPFLCLEIGGHAVFRVIEVTEASRPIETDLVVLERRVLQTETIRTLIRLDMDDLRAEVGEIFPDGGAGRIRA